MFTLTQCVTEKAAGGEARGVYTFTVSGRANKIEIGRYVREHFKVRPLKIRVIKLPRKSITFRGRPASRGGVVKALVYLKPGDKITFPSPIKK